MLDVAIVGGGPVGAAAAALIARAGTLKVAVLEMQAPEPSSADAPPDLRVVALSRASEHILRGVGAWSSLARLSPYERMCIWHESVPARSPDVLVFDAADVGEPNLGYIAEQRVLQRSLLEAFAAAGGEIRRAVLRGLKFTGDAVELATDAGELSARLVVGADGAHSAVRSAAGLSVSVSPYAQTAIVATVATELPHEATAWQRFMKQGTLAFLPLADGTSSIVWSADEAPAKELLALDEREFARALDRASDLALGPTRLTSERRSFPLTRLTAPRYVSERVALLGDAAHVVHPLAGQGVNLGLLDAAALAQLLGEAVARREDPGALAVLRAYERWRKSEVALMAGAIEAFDRLLAHGSGPVARIAQRGLSLVNRSQELRRLFIRRALGLTGELPRAARAS
ncbi:MAG TPA: FAD-dependent monooxygenase [Steroidobacteraceae bacterium]|nr:FAD-dependent monooxygenase [Steroidobacteraceae bacterium]